MEKVKSKINTIQDRLESLKNNLENTSDLAEIDLLLEKIVASRRVGCSPAKRPGARHPAGRTRRFAGPCRAKYL